MLRCKGIPPGDAQEAEPELTRKDAVKQEVVDHLVLLATQSAGSVISEAMSSTSLRRPDPTVQREPEEEGDHASKETVVGGQGGVDAIIRPAPNETVAVHGA